MIIKLIRVDVLYILNRTYIYHIMTAYLYKHKAINNFMQKTRKTKEEIENQIILTLKEKPLSIQQISQKVNSNLSTINEILDKLKKEGKVREIIAT